MKIIHSFIFLTLSLLSASFLRKKHEPFLLENASNLTQEYDKNFLVKIVTQKLMCQILCIFKEKLLIFPQKGGAEKQKC